MSFSRAKTDEVIQTAPKSPHYHNNNGGCQSKMSGDDNLISNLVLSLNLSSTPPPPITKNVIRERAIVCGRNNAIVIE